MMDYKGFIGNVEYDSHKEVINTKDVITFHGHLLHVFCINILSTK
jgi:hypothetical protein